MKIAAKLEIYKEIGLELENNLDYTTSNYFIDSHVIHVIDTIFPRVVKKYIKYTNNT